MRDSLARVDEILAGKDADYSDKDTVPSRDSLTFTNGFYVNCSALFVDMRSSSKLAEKHKNPTLAKIYRSYISELVALFRDNPNIKEISIEGDCVWGIFDTPWQRDINTVFATGYSASSLIDILNYKYSQRGISQIEVGIGAAYGRALMIKAGYKNSGVNEVAWLGAVVAEAAHLCSQGNGRVGDGEIMVSKVFYHNLNEDNQKLLRYHVAYDCHHGDVVQTGMNDWLHKEKSGSTH